MAGALSSSLARGGMATRSGTKPGPGPGGVESVPAPESANETAVPASEEAPAGAANGPADSRSRAASSASHPSGSASGGPPPARCASLKHAEPELSSLGSRARTGGGNSDEEEEEGTSK